MADQTVFVDLGPVRIWHDQLLASQRQPHVTDKKLNLVLYFTLLTLKYVNWNSSWFLEDIFLFIQKASNLL